MRSQSVLLLGEQLARRHAYQCLANQQLPNVTALYARHLATAAPPGDASEGGSAWMPSWVKSKLPGVLGGTKETTENFTLDSESLSLSVM